MPLLTTHTYETLAQFMQAEIREIATDLAMADTTPNGAYEQAINNTLREVGYAAVEDVPATAVRYLELVARTKVWREVVAAYVRAYNAGGAARTLQRDQLFQHARVMLDLSETELTEYLAEQSGTDRGLVDGGAYSTSVTAKYVFPRLY